MISADTPRRCGPAEASLGDRVACKPQPKPLLAANQARISRPWFQPTAKVCAAALSIRIWVASAPAPKVAAPSSARTREAPGESDQPSPGETSTRVASNAALASPGSKPTSGRISGSATLNTAADHRPVDSATTAANSQGRCPVALRWRTRWPMSTLT